jgi:hypothetical protein
MNNKKVNIPGRTLPPGRNPAKFLFSGAKTIVNAAASAVYSMGFILSELVSKALQINSLGVGVAATGVAGTATAPTWAFDSAGNLSLDGSISTTGIYGATTADAAVFPEGLSSPKFVSIGTRSAYTVNGRFSGDSLAVSGAFASNFSDLSGVRPAPLNYGLALNAMAAAPTLPITGSVFYNLASDGTTNISFENGKRFSFGEDYTSASDIDPKITLRGGVNSAELSLDDQINRCYLNKGLYAAGQLVGNYVDSETYYLSSMGYYGDTTSDPSVHPQGIDLTKAITLTEMAEPADPASGKAVMWLDSTSKNLMIKNDTDTITIGTFP